MPVKLEIDGIFWSAGVFPLLRGISLTVERGEIMVIGGRSGCGKSILLEICAGLKRPERGRIVWDDIDIATMSRNELLTARQRIGYVFQQYALIANYSIFENIALPLRSRGDLAEKEIDVRVHTVMEEVALFNVEKHFPESLSNGQLRAAALARALVTDPEMLFLDEPVSGLDPQTASGIRAVLHARQRRRERTIVTICHDLYLWASRPHRVAVLEGGKLVEPEENHAFRQMVEARR
ncbi:MAG: ATP-binding cassette domain-containing protein [Chitinispirillaceae bacterium]|nr:ATP-binding cassette domain-containing protein [Chitinispirillaceae bacterium]